MSDKMWNGTWKPDGTGGWHTKIEKDIVDQYNSARLTPAPAQMLKNAIDEVVRLRAENEKLRGEERERCAKICEENNDDAVMQSYGTYYATRIRKS